MSHTATTQPVREAIILMSALVPTTGHRDLILFGLNQPVDKVNVIVGHLPGEPVTPQTRIEALRDAVTRVQGDPGQRLNFIIMDETIAPSQADKAANVDKFFKDWADLIFSRVDDHGKDLMLIGSDDYCVPQAEAMGVAFVPYDMNRHMNTAQGRVVRAELAENWEVLTPLMRKKFGVTATLFGQESVGKTVVTQRLAGHPAIQGLEEYARPYLEAVGPVITHNKMDTIFAGQAAWQKMAQQHEHTPILVQDTDLFTTIGYYRVNDMAVLDSMLDTAAELVSDVYFIMPDANVPLVADLLRYGGEERETTKQFWVDLCEEFSLKYVLVPEGSEAEKQRFIADRLFTLFHDKTHKAMNFKRTNVDPDIVPVAA